jgi:hypothetical protein
MIRQLRRRRRHGRADGGVGRCEGLVGRTSREVRPESRGGLVGSNFNQLEKRASARWVLKDSKDEGVLHR